MTNLVHHPSFKKRCAWCGAIKFVQSINGIHFKRCPNCDFNNETDMGVEDPWLKR